MTSHVTLTGMSRVNVACEVVVIDLFRVFVFSWLRLCGHDCSVTCEVIVTCEVRVTREIALDSYLETSALAGNVAAVDAGSPARTRTRF